MTRQVISTWIFVWVFAACQPPSATVEEEQAVEKVSPLEESFRDAASAYQVPVELLKSVAYVETRVSDAPGPTPRGAFGLMQLVQREDWNLLSKAHALTGLGEARLRVDPSANILGAASVLRALADESFRQYPMLRAAEIGDWFHAVSLYPGIDSAALAQDYATEVFSVMERGFVVTRPDGVVRSQALASEWRKHAPLGVQTSPLKEYPQAFQWRASPNFASGRSSYDFVVIHTTQGSYAGTLSWFLNSNSSVSSHYVVRSSDGQITQMVEHQDTAWHAGCYNARSIGIEHEGFIADPAKWYTPAMYAESAKLTRWIADRHNIPKDRAHILGHVEIDPVCNRNRHQDPGSGWNWTHYMDLVAGNVPLPGTGKLTGILYENNNTNARVAQATVTVNGQTQVTGTNGLFEFIVPVGTYTLTAEKLNYQTATATASVSDLQTTWSSMELLPAGVGKFVGVIYEFLPSAPADKSKILAGAKIEVGGQQVLANSNGYFEVELPVGTYTAMASHPNYVSLTTTRTVTAGNKVWGSMGLSLQTASVSRPITVSILSPPAGTEVDVASQTLVGNIEDPHGEIRTVEVRTNDGVPSTVEVVKGTFQKNLKLAPGNNVVEVVARTSNGTAVKATTQATFRAGVFGKTHLMSHLDTAIQGVQLELLDITSGERVAEAVSNSEGLFELNVPRVGVDYLLVAKKSGYLTGSETLSVPDDRRVSMQVPMTLGDDVLPNQLAIDWAEPSADAILQTEQVQVFGTVIGMLAKSVQINGVPAELIGAGGFTATVPLVLGENTLEAVAKGSNEERVVAKLRIFREEPQASTPRPKSKGCSSSGLGLLEVTLCVPWLWWRQARRRVFDHKNACGQTNPTS